MNYGKTYSTLLAKIKMVSVQIENVWNDLFIVQEITEKKIAKREETI